MKRSARSDDLNAPEQAKRAKLGLVEPRVSLKLDESPHIRLDSKMFSVAGFEAHENPAALVSIVHPLLPAFTPSVKNCNTGPLLASPFFSSIDKYQPSARNRSLTFRIRSSRLDAKPLRKHSNRRTNRTSSYKRGDSKRRLSGAAKASAAITSTPQSGVELAQDLADFPDDYVMSPLTVSPLTPDDQQSVVEIVHSPPKTRPPSRTDQRVSTPRPDYFTTRVSAASASILSRPVPLRAPYEGFETPDRNSAMHNIGIGPPTYKPRLTKASEDGISDLFSSLCQVEGPVSRRKLAMEIARAESSDCRGPPKRHHRRH